jgi:hypothetical protein
MYPPNDNTAPSRSVLMRFLVRSREYRYPHVWVRVRVACGVFNVVLAVLLLTSGLPPADQCPELAWKHLPVAGSSNLRPAWGDAAALRLRFRSPVFRVLLAAAKIQASGGRF